MLTMLNSMLKVFVAAGRLFLHGWLIQTRLAWKGCSIALR